MKAKINFSGEGIKQFFLANGEKIVLTLTVLILFAFLYSAITAKPLDETKSPDAINQKSRQLVSTIQSATWPPPDRLPEKTDFKSQAESSIRPVSGQTVRPTREWNPPLFPELIKRADPQIFPPEELQVAAGCGIVPYRSAAAAGGMAFGNPIGNPGIVFNEHGGAPIGQAPLGPGGIRQPGGVRPGEEAKAAAAAAAQPVRIEPNAPVQGVRAVGQEMQRKTYAIITGAMPVEREMDEYRQRFESAVPAIADPNVPGFSGTQPGQLDFPRYFCFLIERSEVKDANDKSRNWVPILARANYLRSDALADVPKWFNAAPEIVHPDDVFQPEPVKEQYAFITWPLPPLMLKNWGFEATHPKVRLNIVQDTTQEPQPEPQQNGDLESINPQASGGAVGGMNSRLGGMANEHGPPVIGMRPPVQGGPIMGGGLGNRGPMSGGVMSGQPGSQVSLNPYKLFRFVDLAAEPGKTYRYRVQFLLYNSNYGLKAECLDPKAIQADTAKKKLAESPWVETPPITIPRDFQVLADSVNVPGGRLADLKAKIDLLAVAKVPVASDPASGMVPASPDTFVEVAKEIELPLGGIAFLRDAEIDKVTDMSTETVRKLEKVSVDTDQMMLLDVRNDKPLGDGKSKDNVEMLFIDASGHLIDASKAADRLVLADFQERTKVPEVAATTDGGYPTPIRPGPGGVRPPAGEHGPPVRAPVYPPKNSSRIKDS